MDGVKKRIKQLRKEKGLTGTALAELIGVSQGNISDWENEKRTSTPTTKALIAMAKELNVSLNWLLLGEGNQYLDEKRIYDNEVHPDEYSLILKLRALDRDNQAEAVEIIERKYARSSKENLSSNSLNGENEEHSATRDNVAG
jgi:transcriptional regulator with XRE-family HTH domain